MVHILFLGLLALAPSLISSLKMPCPKKPDVLITKDEPVSPGPFDGLTKKEIQLVVDFVKGNPEINISAPADVCVNSSYMLTVDLLPPPKAGVLNFLDQKERQPPREAMIIVFRGDKDEPVVEEYKVGPLSNPSYATLLSNPQRKNPIPFAVRPFGKVEYDAIKSELFPKIEDEIGKILLESYGTSNMSKLAFIHVPVGTNLLGETLRKVWMLGYYESEFYSLYPLGLGFLLNLEGKHSWNYTVEKVWYAGAMYDSIADLVDKYNNDPPTINKTRLEFVTKEDPEEWTTLKMRGEEKVDKKAKRFPRAPQQFALDGQRYTIDHQKITYLDWTLNVRLSTINGPQLYDVRFRDDRIAYEAGLAEIATFYTGDSPFRYLNLVESGFLLGSLSKSLIEGADCPEDATFLSVNVLEEGSDKPTTLKRAMCVFEHNTNLPLRRHMSYSRKEGSFYGGMSNTVLVIRAILAVDSSDYVVDFELSQKGDSLFWLLGYAGSLEEIAASSQWCKEKISSHNTFNHLEMKENGVLGMKVIAAGYLIAQQYRTAEDPYGWHLRKNITANMHHHMFNFKVDLDIGGTSNRYETLDISAEDVPLTENKTYSQIKFTRNLRLTEQDALYYYNFNDSLYHIVHNDNLKTETGVPRSYMIHIKDMSNQELPEGVDNEVSIPWARHPLAVTVRKEEEQTSSSPYASFDSLDPVNDFSKFVTDEDIVDKDLVMWISMGSYHIPQTEDLPTIPTVGHQLSAYIMPYNYFEEDPSMTSHDHIRIQYLTMDKPEDGLLVERNGRRKNKGYCKKKTLEMIAKKSPDELLEV